MLPPDGNREHDVYAQFDLQMAQAALHELRTRCEATSNCGAAINIECGNYECRARFNIISGAFETTPGPRHSKERDVR